MEFFGGQTTNISLWALEGSYRNGSKHLQDMVELRQKEKRRHPLKKPDHSKKLSFENNMIANQYL